MKKRIVSLVGALVLTFAMSLNVFADYSPKAQDIVDAAGGVDVPATQVELEASAVKAQGDIKTEGVTAKPLSQDEALVLATKLGELYNQDNTESVTVEYVFDVQVNNNDINSVVIGMELASNEIAVAIHIMGTGEVERIIGTRNGDKVSFEFQNGFSPVAIVKVVNKPAPGVAGAAPAAPAAAAPAAAAVAPKTGDVVMMVSIMAVIFMAGAAVAVAMSKKRA